MSAALSIVGLGAVTAVGLSAPQTCAAIRARLSGFREDARLLPPPAEPVLCAMVPGREKLKQTQSGWLVHLASRAIKECTQGHDLRRSRLALLMALPDSYRNHPAVDRVGALGILYGIQLQLRLSLSNASDAIPAGHAAALQCLLKARELLGQDEVDLCIVGGVDSLVNRQDIEGLQAASRLHGETNPQGTIPGEGAAFLLVGAAAKWQSQALAQVLGIGLGNERDTIRGERFATGEGLRAALEAAASDARCAESELSLRVSDMNGERYRAWDSMTGSTRFYRTRRERLSAWYPAASAGDTGAAAGALGVIAATVGIMRGYAPGSLAMCETSSDDGLRAACVVAPAPGKRSPPFRMEAAKGEIAEESLWISRSGASSKKAVIPAIIAQHVEEAPFLWSQRHLISERPDTSLADLLEIDERLDASLDGVRTAGPSARRLCASAISANVGGELFTATWLALKDRNGNALLSVLDAAEPEEDRWKEVTAAFAWVPPADLERVVGNLLGSSSPFRRYVGMASCLAHQVLPGRALELAVADVAPRLRALALRSIGELGLRAEASRCRDAYADKDTSSRFWAGYSGFLLGDTDGATPVLLAACLAPGPDRQRAIGLLLRALPVADAHNLVRGLRATPDGEGLLVRGSGIIGNPDYIPWLIGKMRDPATARLAGEAFSAITGLDLSTAGMALKTLDGAQVGRSDESDENNIAVDLDDYLAWPDANQLQEWWQSNSGRFRVGTRYFAGEPVSIDQCARVLREGYQRQRAAAALYISLLRPGTPLFATTAPAWRQRSALAS